uniref:MAC-inhibitory protein n=1 Tax=Anabas testudineus TaxID=64144 RepID=A0A3Q1IN68_ANATE
MKRCLGPFLLLCCGMLPLGSGLSCYSCSENTGVCKNVSECVGQDSCLSLKIEGGKSIHQCIMDSECSFKSLAQQFPQVSKFTFECCNRNLCNSGHSFTTATATVTVVGLLLSVGWSWI